MNLEREIVWHQKIKALAIKRVTELQRVTSGEEVIRGEWDRKQASKLLKFNLQIIERSTNNLLFLGRIQ